MSWSLDQVRSAWRDQFYDRAENIHDYPGDAADAQPRHGYVDEVFNDFVLVSYQDRVFWTVPYTVEDSGIRFGAATPVKRVYVPAAAATTVSSVALSSTDAQQRIFSSAEVPDGTLYLSDHGRHVVIDPEQGAAPVESISDPEVEAVLAKVDQMLSHVRS